MRKLLYFVLFGTFIFAISSCGGKKEEGNPEADSLQNVLDDKTSAMDELSLFLDAVNASMDSVVNMEGSILKTKGESPASTKEQIKRNIESYKIILKHQRERLALLEQKLKNSDEKSQKMLKTVEALKKQIEEKDAAIADLMKEIDKRDFDIKELKTHVESLNNHVAELDETNKAQEEALQTQTDMMNEAYYIVGTKKELKAAGLLSGGSLFSKSKLDMKNVDTSVFKKIDIRKTKTFSIPSKKPQIMSQVPNGSYTLTQNADGTSTLTITDAAKFWSLTNYLIIKY